jgi:hypothetical protein
MGSDKTQSSTNNMNKPIGFLCIAVVLASLGWRVTQAALTPGRSSGTTATGEVIPEPSYVDVGYLRVKDGSVLKFENGTITSVSGRSTSFSIELPLTRKIDLAIYTTSSAACLLAAIALLKPKKA